MENDIRTATTPTALRLLRHGLQADHVRQAAVVLAAAASGLPLHMQECG